MDITLGALVKLPIKRLKIILQKLKKEPESDKNLATIEIITKLIRDKKRQGTILHPAFKKVGDKMVRNKAMPIHSR